jgi:hypothetical protein
MKLRTSNFNASLFSELGTQLGILPPEPPRGQLKALAKEDNHLIKYLSRLHNRIELLEKTPVNQPTVSSTTVVNEITNVYNTPITNYHQELPQTVTIVKVPSPPTLQTDAGTGALVNNTDTRPSARLDHQFPLDVPVLFSFAKTQGYRQQMVEYYGWGDPSPWEYNSLSRTDIAMIFPNEVNVGIHQVESAGMTQLMWDNLYAAKDFTGSAVMAEQGGGYLFSALSVDYQNIVTTAKSEVLETEGTSWPGLPYPSRTSSNSDLKSTLLGTLASVPVVGEYLEFLPDAATWLSENTDGSINSDGFGIGVIDPISCGVVKNSGPLSTFTTSINTMFPVPRSSADFDESIFAVREEERVITGTSVTSVPPSTVPDGDIRVKTHSWYDSVPENYRQAYTDCRARMGSFTYEDKTLPTKKSSVSAIATFPDQTFRVTYDVPAVTKGANVGDCIYLRFGLPNKGIGITTDTGRDHYLLVAWWTGALWVYNDLGADQALPTCVVDYLNPIS